MSPLSEHDLALVRDLRRQPFWLIGLYGATAVVACGAAIAFSGGGLLPEVLAIAGGVLAGLAIEKLVSRRLRRIALLLLDQQDEG